MGGEKVHPTEIENVLLQLDNVKDVTVRGQPNPITGEVVAAEITPLVPEDPDALKRRVRQFCQRAARALQNARGHRCGRGGSLRRAFQEIAQSSINSGRHRHAAPDRKLAEREDTTTMPQTRKVALVSGGSRGLGAELVSGFLDRRYGVATLSRTKTAFITDMLRARKRRAFPLERSGWTRSRGVARLREGSGRAVGPDRRARQQCRHCGGRDSADDAHRATSSRPSK